MLLFCIAALLSVIYVHCDHRVKLFVNIYIAFCSLATWSHHGDQSQVLSPTKGIKYKQ